MAPLRTPGCQQTPLHRQTSIASVPGPTHHRTPGTTHPARPCTQAGPVLLLAGWEACAARRGSCVSSDGSMGSHNQTFHCTARHPRGFLSTGRRRALLRSPVLQDQLPTIPRGFRPLHFQSRMLESPCNRQDMAPLSVRHHSPSLLRQLGHSSSHKLRKSFRPDHQRFPSGTLVACCVPRRPTGSSAQARSRHDRR